MTPRQGDRQRVERPTRSVAILLIVIVAAFTAAVCAVAMMSIHVTDAAWNTSKSEAVTVTAAAPAAPAGFVCDNASGALVTSVGFHWTANSATTAAPVPTAYRLVIVNNATSAVAYADPTTTTTTQSVGGAVLTLAGSYSVSVQARYGDATGAWYSASSTVRTLTVSLGALGIIVSYNCG